MNYLEGFAIVVAQRELARSSTVIPRSEPFGSDGSHETNVLSLTGSPYGCRVTRSVQVIAFTWKVGPYFP